jgi:hypothetical protein
MLQISSTTGKQDKFKLQIMRDINGMKNEPGAPGALAAFGM